jgi:hypothetical protein
VTRHRITLDVDPVEFEAEWRSRVPVRQLAELYGVREHVVTRHAHDLGLPSRRALQRGDEHDDEGGLALDGGRWQGVGGIVRWVPA